jgi:hypothetical protein
MKAHDWTCRWFPLIPEERLIESKIPEERLAEPKIHFVKELEGERWKQRGTRPVELKSYPQVFADRFPFEKDLSIIDAIFNLGKTSIKTLGHVNNS